MIKPPETIPDKIVRYFAPTLARKRQQARAMMAVSDYYSGGIQRGRLGGYEGASRVKRALSTWFPWWRDANADIDPDHWLLRSRSRDLVRNNPLAAGAINGVVTNVVGTGLRLHARIDGEFLGMTDEESDSWEADIERRWEQWSESPECDAAATSNFAQLQDMAFRGTLESGDIFITLPRFYRRNHPSALHLQLVESDRCSNPNFLYDTPTCAGGVERDQYGAPTGYHFTKYHPGAMYVGVIPYEWLPVVPAFSPKSGLRNVLHLYRPLRPDQARGVPYLAPVIEPIKQLGRYTDAEIMAAVVSGLFTVFIETEDGDGQLDVEYGTDKPGTTDATNPDNDYRLGNGSIIGLMPGEKITTADPKRPNTAFDPFVQAILRQIGTALEVPFEILIKHFTSSYSASRAAILEAWKFFSARRKWLSDNLCNPVYEIWMYEEVVSGRVKAPGFLTDPIKRKAYLGVVWTGPGRGMIDEVKEEAASNLRVLMTKSTLEEETAAQGKDWKKLIRQTAKEHKILGELGIPPVLTRLPGQPKPAPQETPSGDNSELPPDSGGSEEGDSGDSSSATHDLALRTFLAAVGGK